MSRQNIFRQINSKVDLIGTDVVLELDWDGEETGVVATDYLVLEETLLEGVGGFEWGRLLF